MTRPATTLDETPVFFPAGGDDLFGIFTRPTTEANGMAVIMLSGGAWTPSPGRNRIWVRLARRLAGYGFHAMRLDYHGVGESSGLTSTYVLHQPFTEDVHGAADWIRGQGVSRFVLVGTCFGARTALATAARLEGVVGVALLATPTRDFTMNDRIASLPASWYVGKLFSRKTLSRLADPRARRTYARLVADKLRWAVGRMRSGPGRPAAIPAEESSATLSPAAGARSGWISPRVVDQLDTLVGRNVPVLLLYGEDDDFYENFCRARSGPLGEILDRAGALVTVDVSPGKMHGLASSEIQDHALTTLTAWLSQLSPVQSGGLLRGAP